MTSLPHAETSSELLAASLRRIKLCALGFAGVMTAGMAGLMVLAAGKDEDIAGIVAPALLLTVLAVGVALVAAIWQKRAEKAR